MKNKDIITFREMCNMEFHEEKPIDLFEKFWVKRVPGGWLYIQCFEFSNSITFVPYNDEFKKDAE